jgi:hypothetical protein
VLDSRSVLPNRIPNACYKRHTGAPFPTRAWLCFPAMLVKSAIVAGIAWRYLSVLQACCELRSIPLLGTSVNKPLMYGRPAYRSQEWQHNTHFAGAPTAHF